MSRVAPFLFKHGLVRPNTGPVERAKRKACQNSPGGLGSLRFVCGPRLGAVWYSTPLLDAVNRGYHEGFNLSVVCSRLIRHGILFLLSPNPVLHCPRTAWLCSQCIVIGATSHGKHIGFSRNIPARYNPQSRHHYAFESPESNCILERLNFKHLMRL